uniref:Mitochondrial outer membrane protein porin of 34 kDa n=1 Tax=Rhizophora mucronata TaxID=61149 RepID=A0A2P2K8P2_RHIMU
MRTEEITARQLCCTPYAQITAPHATARNDHHGLRANAKPTLALFSIALVSTSPERVKKDFGRHSC